MDNVIVLGRANAETKIVCQALEQQLQGACLRCVNDIKDAMRLLALEGAQAIVALIARLNAANLAFLRWVGEIAPTARVVVVSSEPLSQVANSISMLGVSGYYLRPVRPARLALALVPGAQASSQGVAPAGAVSVSEGSDRVARLAKAVLAQLYAYRYRACLEAAHEGLELIWGGAGSASDIEREVLGFAGLLLDELGDTARAEREGTLAKMRFKVNQPFALYETYLMFERLVGRLFDDAAASRAEGAGEVRLMLNYVDRNIRSELRLADVAKFVNMSPTYFSKYFKRETGEGFVSYVTDRKMELARFMLEKSDLSVVQISGELSYTRPSYFSKLFKKVEGVSPSEYRERRRVDVSQS